MAQEDKGVFRENQSAVSHHLRVGAYLPYPPCGDKPFAGLYGEYRRRVYRDACRHHQEPQGAQGASLRGTERDACQAYHGREA